MALIYEEETYKIRGCLMEVHRILGPGYREETYRQAVIREFKRGRIPFETEKAIDILYRDEVIDSYRLDFLAYGNILIEIKAVAEMPNQFEAYTLSYMRAGKFQ